MSGESRGENLPSPWADFLQEVDALLSRPVELHCLGGFVLTMLYGLPRSTGDVDYISAMPSEDAADILRIAGPDSQLARKHRVHLEYVTIADRPEEYDTRLREMFPNRFAKLRLCALDVHDIVLAKLTRNSLVDDEDVRFLIQTGALDPAILRDRYQSELRPNLSNQERHDTTLQLWLAYFQQ